MATMHVELVSIEKSLWSGEASAVFARTTEGQLGILPGHIPLLGALAPGFAVRIDREDGEPLSVAVHGGFLSVGKKGVSVLAEQAELAEDIDAGRARDALSRNDGDDSEQSAARNRAKARLRAVGEDV